MTKLSYLGNYGQHLLHPGGAGWSQAEWRGHSNIALPSWCRPSTRPSCSSSWSRSETESTSTCSPPAWWRSVDHCRRYLHAATVYNSTSHDNNNNNHRSTCVSWHSQL